MNLYGVVTGTNDYALNVSFPPGFRLCVGDTITINPINANTGAVTLSIGGMAALPVTLNGNAMTSGQLEAGKDRQCTFKGSSFAADNAGGGAFFSGTSSQVTLGDGSAGIVPAGAFGNLSASDIPLQEKARFTKSSNQTGGASYAEQIAAWNTAVLNQATNWTNSSGTLTCNKAGRYRILLQIGLSAATTQYIAILLNGSPVAYNAPIVSMSAPTMQCLGEIDCAIGDTIKGAFYSFASSNLVATQSFIDLIYTGRAS